MGAQKEKAQVHILDIANLVATRAPDESSDPGEDYMEELVAAACVNMGGVEPAGKTGSCGGDVVGCQSEVDLAGPTLVVGGGGVDHRLTHKPTGPTCVACLRGK